LREHFAELQIGEVAPQTKIPCDEVTDIDQFPLWTWFIPNPCR
jgi:hypothetical protein